MKVLLTKRAENNYRSIKKHITIEWSDKVAAAFDQRIIDFLDLIEKFPEMGVIEVPEKGIRSFLITKQTRIFYRLKKDTLIILTFFDTRQNPKKRPK